MKWLVLISGCVIGYIAMIKSRELVRLVGVNAWAEHKLGPGGSNTMWKLIGLLVIVFSFLYFTGDILNLRDFIRNIFT